MAGSAAFEKDCFVANMPTAASGNTAGSMVIPMGDNQNSNETVTMHHRTGLISGGNPLTELL